MTTAEQEEIELDAVVVLDDVHVVSLAPPESRQAENKGGEACQAGNSVVSQPSAALALGYLTFLIKGSFEFPQLTNEDFEKYSSYDLERAPEHSFCIALLVPFVVTRFNLSTIGTSTFMWILGFIFFLSTLTSGCAHMIIFGLRYAASRSTLQTEKSKYASYADALLDLKGWAHLPSLHMILGTVSCAFYLLARVLAGECPPNVTVWQSQSCNTEAASHSIPQDNVLFIYAYPLLIMSFASCSSLYALVISFAVAGAAVIASLAIVQAPLQLYSGIYCLLFFFVGLNIEKTNRVRFLSQKKAESLSDQRRKLLRAVLPDVVIDSVIEGKEVEPTAHPHVCTFFSDIVNFTELTEQIGPFAIAKLLGRLYTVMDECVKETKGVWKVETIGDAFFAECGVVNSNGSLEANIYAILDFAMLVHERVSEITNPLTGEPLELRIGINCGECVAGLVGTQRLMPHFCLFGDLVNVTSRLETTSNPRCIQVGSAVRDVIVKSERYAERQYLFELRGTVDLKGKGRMQTWWFRGTSSKRLLLTLGHVTKSSPSGVGHPFFSFSFDVNSVAPDNATLVDATFTLIASLVDLDAINVNPSTLKCFLRSLGDGYFGGNAYHNFHHSFCVAQFTAAFYWHCFLKGRPNPKRPVSQTIFVVMIAAISHDVGHDGLSNAWHVNTNSPLAKSFFGNSPLEHHHMYVLNATLSHSGCNVFENFSSEMREVAHSCMFNAILATDMKNHKAIERELCREDGSIPPEMVHALSLFHGGGREKEIADLDNALSGADADLPAESAGLTRNNSGSILLPRNNSIATTDIQSLSHHDSLVSIASDDSPPTTHVSVLYDLIMLSRIIVHTADISLCVRPFAVARPLVLQLYKEHSIEAIDLRCRGLLVPPSMEPDSQHTLCIGEAAFIRNVSQPYFNAVVQAFPECYPLLTNLHENIEAWEKEATECTPKQVDGAISECDWLV